MRWLRLGWRLTGVALGLAMAAAALPGIQQAAAAPAPAGDVADVAITGSGAPDGYHLYIARSSSRWAWRPLALLAPGGSDGGRWTGQECVTGDGRTAVAVVAPWQAVNSAVGKDRGGTAISVDLATGKASVIAAGVSLYYFNPGCGTGSDVTLTRYLGSDQQTTQVLRVNAMTGTVAQAETVNTEVTSGVPVGGSVVGAEGNRLVRLAGNAVTTLASLPQAGFDLRPDAVSGVDLLTYAASSAKTTTAWRWAAGRLSRLSAGARGRVALMAGGAGRTVLTGSGAVAAAGLSARPRSAGPVFAISLRGSAELVEPPRGAQNAADLLPELRSPSGRLLRAAAVAPKTAVDTAVMTGTVPRDRQAALGGASVPAGDEALQKAAAAQAAAAATPACAVPRDNLSLQVPQPSNDQVNWAVREAVINSLPSRPAGFDNLPVGYSPQNDFAQPRLTGTNAAGAHVPEVLVDAIMAQESNWDQASFHAPPGMPGDPLVADYYGTSGSLANPINYAASDCGYGIGQLTTIMFAGAASPAVQDRAAVDYTENIAAIVQLLAQKWNTLQAAGIIVNNGDPNWLENWYDTIWAYNSGTEPNAANGNTTGCTPGPGCADSAGNWGLGWANNPINPVYPPERPVFLSDSYADASTPGNWPYQELVFGWMATALLRVEDGGTTGTPAYGTTSQFLVQPPLSAFCSAAAGYDHCNPSDPAGQYCGYQSGPLAYHCWWHQPVRFAGGCLAVGPCTRAGMSETPGQGEPGAVNPDSPTCGLDASQITPINGTDPGPGSTGTDPVNTITLVTDEATSQNPAHRDVNLAGCPAVPSGWTSDGTFSLTNVSDASGNPLPGQVDFHQLGAGFGGHMWFTHMVASSDTAHTVTATWAPDLNTTAGGAGVYAIYVFVPDVGATAQAVYHVSTNNAGSSPFTAHIDQSQASGWVNIGQYYLTPGASVSLSNAAGSASLSDLGIGAVAFNRVFPGSRNMWVALGDSYSSGEGAPAFEPGTDVPGVDMCHRGSFSPSSQALFNTTYYLALVACSGATSAQLTSGRFTEGDQLAALSANTLLVTVTIGGNDLGFANILEDCVDKVDLQIIMQDCENDWEPSLDGAISGEEAQLVEDYQEIAKAAPHAEIVVSTYPQIFPTTSTGQSACPDIASLTANDAAWLAGETVAFNKVIKEAVATASSAGTPVHIDDEEATFNGHDVCSSHPWVNRINIGNILSALDPSAKQQLFHPNYQGYQAEGGVLHQTLVRLLLANPS